jgi:hypothetical protein
MWDLSSTTTSTRRADQRSVQLLTSRALMAALDPSLTLEEASAELARHSRGDVDVLWDVLDAVELIADEHPGPDATRSVMVVEGALIRIRSLQRHPSSRA